MLPRASRAHLSLLSGAAARARFAGSAEHAPGFGHASPLCGGVLTSAEAARPPIWLRAGGWQAALLGLTLLAGEVAPARTEEKPPEGHTSRSPEQVAAALSALAQPSVQSSSSTFSAGPDSGSWSSGALPASYGGARGAAGANANAGDQYERVADRYASLREGGGGSSEPAFGSRDPSPMRPLGPILAQKFSAAMMGGLTGAIVGGSVGVVGTLVQTGRLAGALTNAAGGAAFMGTIFAAGGAWQG